MEQQLDATYLRPSFVSKALGLSIVALGVGAAILLGAFGISFLWRPVPTAIDLKIKNPELTVTQSAPFVLANPPTASERTITTRSLPNPAHSGDEGGSRTDVIQQEVIIFTAVKHERGSVVTGWKFPNGSGQIPSGQFCYFTMGNADRSSTRIDLAIDERPIVGTAAANVPELEQAISKCKWWHA
jgi:hypothetical protein